jgi:DNA-binding MarR family transcriptional regulator
MAKKDKSDSNSEDVPASASVIADVERLSRLMRQASHAHGLVPVHWETLRYLERANRFSNSPGAIARYLGTTKGTISQTVLTLVKRGLLQKVRRGRDSRSSSLTLTPAAVELLGHDPQNTLRADIDRLSGKTARRFAKAVSQLLEAEVRRSAESSFGTCATCRHFRIETNETFTCLAFLEALEANDTDRICHGHEA